jgi:hypothetical protein
MKIKNWNIILVQDISKSWKVYLYYGRLCGPVVSSWLQTQKSPVQFPAVRFLRSSAAWNGVHSATWG